MDQVHASRTFGNGLDTLILRIYRRKIQIFEDLNFAITQGTGPVVDREAPALILIKFTVKYMLIDLSNS